MTRKLQERCRLESAVPKENQSGFACIAGFTHDLLERPTTKVIPGYYVLTFSGVHGVLARYWSYNPTPTDCFGSVQEPPELSCVAGKMGDTNRSTALRSQPSEESDFRPLFDVPPP